MSRHGLTKQGRSYGGGLFRLEVQLEDDMGEFLPLAARGQRIMICGPSNTGKSTLCVALARKLQVEAYHVDLFRHLPGTNWVQRSDEEFAALHDEAIAHPRSVISKQDDASGPAGLPLIELNSMRELQRLYREWGLER